MNIRLSEIEISFAKHVQFFNKIFLFKLDSFIRKCQKIVDCMYMILIYHNMFVSGYTGSQCETYECISAVCPTNSQCVDGINSFSCVCLEGKIGELCDKGWGQYHQVINTWILHLCCINYQNYGKLTCEINVHLLRWVQMSIFLLHLYRFVFFLHELVMDKQP